MIAGLRQPSNGKTNKKVGPQCQADPMCLFLIGFWEKMMWSVDFKRLS